jgi:Acetyltransferase (GNAT) domain
VLTTESHRRRGLATANLHWAIERCAARGLIAGLDATAAGREVYAPLGFTDLWGLQRLRAAGPGRLPEPRHSLVIRPMREDDLAAVTAMDAEAFGAARGALLAYLRACQPGCAWTGHEPGGALAGFVLGRPGRATLHLGPLIARDPDVATALAARALAHQSAPVSIDVPDDQQAFRQRLTLAGFAPLRPFTRMLRCDSLASAEPSLTFAIAGPELG